MSVVKAGLVRRAMMTLVAGAAISAPLASHASFLDGLSVRVGFFRPQRNAVRTVTDYGAFGAGVDYKLPFVPKLFNGEGWSTSISADYFHSQRKSGRLMYVPVSINQVYNFEEHGGVQSYAGFSFTAATTGATATPTTTRFGAGLILGINLTHKIYVEGRYDWIDNHGTTVPVDGLRVYAGYRF
jgi:hypothetical protein